jgi:uncharacterized glyoxalase superfamily protein PhnB
MGDMSELTPYLSVADARAASAWYVDHLGAVVTYEPIVMPDGRVGHTELAVDGARWMMADAHPEIRSPAPVAGEGTPVTLHLTVADVDAVVARVVSGGASLDRGPEDIPIGRVAVFRDPFGHRWFLHQPVGDAG